MRCGFIRPHRQQINGKLMREALARELKVFAHFADEEEQMEELLALRVDGIVTGRPKRLKKVLQGAKA